MQKPETCDIVESFKIPRIRNRFCCCSRISFFYSSNSSIFILFNLDYLYTQGISLWGQRGYFAAEQPPYKFGCG
jgi:hypothetical protein